VEQVDVARGREVEVEASERVAGIGDYPVATASLCSGRGKDPRGRRAAMKPREEEIDLAGGTQGTVFGRALEHGNLLVARRRRRRSAGSLSPKRSSSRY
jgi:hypothetical protein